MTLTTVNALQVLAENTIRSYLAWAQSTAETLNASATTNLQLRALGSNVTSFGALCDAVTADAGYSGLGADLRADIETIQSTMVTVTSLIAGLVEPDAHFAALSSDRQTEIETEAAETWDDVPADLKPDLLQHDLVDADTIASIVDALLVA